jgi:hypothetical protein
MVNIVKDELDGNELALYMHTAEEVKQEIARPNPDKKAVHRWLSMLAFLSDVEGPLQLGERTLGLAFAVIPYLPALADALHNLLFKQRPLHSFPIHYRVLNGFFDEPLR